MASICLPASTPTSSRSTISRRPGSPNKAAFDAGFLSFFGFTKNAPAAANITAAQMDNFLTTVVEPQFLGAGWQGTWSNATDEGITSRIALNETVRDLGQRQRGRPCASSPWRPQPCADMFDSNVSDDRPQGGAHPRREPGRRSNERPRQSELQDRHRREPRQERQRPHQHAGRPVREATSSNWKGSIPTKPRRGCRHCFSRSKLLTR